MFLRQHENPQAEIRGVDESHIIFGTVLDSDDARAPAKKRQNRRIPDVCETFGVSCCNPFKVTRELGFKTGWKGGSRTFKTAFHTIESWA